VTEYGDLIFCGALGEPLRQDNLIKRLKTVLKQAELPAMRSYDLRHSHATQLLKDGVNPKVVAERLGHASVTLTLDTYSHVSATMQAQVVAGLERLVAA
jgi:integrase